MKQVIVQQLMDSHAIIHGKDYISLMTIITQVPLIMDLLVLTAIQLMDIIAIKILALIAIYPLDICAQQVIK
jgi:hypothetical protein